MAVKSRKDRIGAIIDAVNKAAAGDYSLKLDRSAKNDEIDSLAEAVNKMMEKTAKRITGHEPGDISQRQSEERYRNILDAIEESYFEVDLKGNLQFFNDSVVKALGYTAAEIRDVNFRRLADEENVKKVLEAFHKVFVTGKTIKGFDWEILKKNGGNIPVESSVSLRHDKQGKPVGFRGIVRDITARKQMEKELRLSEKRYRTILDIMDEAYIEDDLSGTITFANNTACKLLGYSSDELIGLSYRDYLTPAAAQSMREVYHRIYQTGKPELLVDYEIIRQDGTVKTYQFNAAPMLDEEGKINGFRVLTWDVTQRKKAEEDRRLSEEKYRNILESMDEAYLETDLNGNFIFFNDSLCRVLGYSSTELQNINYRRISPPGSKQKIFEMFNEIYNTGKKKTFMHHAVMDRDGSIKFLEMSIALMRSPAEEPTGFGIISRDVTEKIKVTQAIEESERQLRLITENIRDIIWTMDFDLRFTYISPSIFRITGFRAEELLKIPLKGMLLPPVYALIEKSLAEILAKERDGQYKEQGQTPIFEFELMRRDGKSIWVEISADFSRDENGRPLEIVGVARDITERRKTEDALQESEKRYRMMAQNIHDVIWLFDLNLQFNYVSPSNVLIIGYTPEETMGMSLNELLSPASFALAAQTLSEELAAEESGEPIDPYRSRTLEMEVNSKSGGIVWLEVTATFNRDDNGKANEILAVGRNITERRKIEMALTESEKRYRMIVENMQDTIWTMDFNLQYTYVSPSTTSFTGYSPEEVRNTPIKELLTPASYALAKKMLSEELVHEFGGDPVVDPHGSRTIELEVSHKNGGSIWVEITASFNRDENGKAIGLLLAGRDITKRKKIEEEKDKLEKQLLHAQKMESVGRLAGGVAHDFNNMLNVILGYADLIKLKLPEGNPVLEDIGEIEKAANRSRDITTQLLAFSRKQVVAPIILNLNELIKNIENSLPRLIGEDIDLRFYPAGDLGNIRIDPSQIEQIIFNLVINARDAMPAGGKLTLETANIRLDENYCSTHLGFQSGQYVLLTVSDDGQGIDAETLQHIFEPFFTTKEMGKGTGLGLATVYGIVKQNGGFINIYSEPGQGTAFKIYFLRDMEEVKIAESHEEVPVEAASGIILLVEDDELLRNMITEMLETIGYTVIAEANPLDALSLYEKKETFIDLIITDVVMPKMNGKELRDRLRIIRPNIKVLFMSGYTSNVIVHHGVLEEGVHFLQKPFNMNALANKVREVIGSK